MIKLLLALSLLVFNAALAQAQAPFYQGKTITIVVGTKAGDAYDLYPRMLAEFMPKHIPGSTNIINTKCPGRGVDDRCEPGLQCCQARWFDPRRHLSGALLRATYQEAGGEVRLDQIHLDPQSGYLESSLVHALRYSLQIDG